MARYNDDGAEVLDNETGDSLPVAVSSGLQSITAAEINQAVATAKQFPRRRDKEISNEIMGRATLDEATAEKCNYLLPRGNKKIPGPSIRFAEIVRASYWNIRVAARFVALDTSDMERAAVIVEAIALDVETNQSEIVPVRRSIMTSAKQGQRPQIYSADMINQTMQAATSIARRNAILTVVPQVLWMGGYQRVVEVLRGTVETLAARRVAMLDAFGRMGVTPEQVFTSLDIKDESQIVIDHMPYLRGMMTAIKDGESVESVLGRMSITEAQPHKRVANPLRDEVRGSTAAEEQREPAASISTGGERVDPNQAADEPEQQREDPISSGRASKPAGERQDEGAAKTAAPAEPAQKPAAAKVAAAQTGVPTYNDEDGLLVFLRWHFQHTKVPTVLKTVWAESRADRRELLSGDNNATITTEYNAAQAAMV